MISTKCIPNNPNSLECITQKATMQEDLTKALNSVDTLTSSNSTIIILTNKAFIRETILNMIGIIITEVLHIMIGVTAREEAITEKGLLGGTTGMKEAEEEVILDLQVEVTTLAHLTPVIQAE